MTRIIPLLLALLCSFSIFSVQAEEYLPRDNSFIDYHTSPRYRPSEEHYLRYLAYAFHPIGWIAREVFTRPITSLMASTEFTRSFFGYREQGDFRRNDCFSSSLATPDCRSFPPYNYDGYEQDMGVQAEEASYAAETQVYFPNVNFDFDSSTLNDLGRAKVNQISEMLADAGGVTVVLEGHTDNVGSDDYNNTLGLDRAEAVRAELINLGVSAENLSTVTFGKTNPVVDEDSEWARALNRRVEVHPGA